MAEDLIIRCVECGTRFVWPANARQSEAPRCCAMCQRLAPAPGRQRGLVKWYSRSKGYGFITPASGPELFVHKSGLAPDQPLLRAGQLVEFAMGTGPRGAQAVDVVALQ